MNIPRYQRETTVFLFNQMDIWFNLSKRNKRNKKDQKHPLPPEKKTKKKTQLSNTNICLKNFQIVSYQNFQTKICISISNLVIFFRGKA